MDIKVRKEKRPGGFKEARGAAQDRELLGHLSPRGRRDGRVQDIGSALRQDGQKINQAQAADKGTATGTGREKAIEKVKHPAIREILHQDLELLDQLMKEKQQAKSRVIRLSKNFPVIERFKKMPGIGPILAAQFVAFVQNPHRFNKRRLWAFSRLGIAKRSSDGVSLGPERLSRSGNGSMKDLSRKAYEAAMRTRDPNGIKIFYGCSLSRTGDPNHARLNTQRKILATMLAMWRDGTEYSDDLVLGKRA